VLAPADPASICQSGSISEDDDAWLDEMEWVKLSLSLQTINRAARAYNALFEEPVKVPDWTDDHWARYRAAVAVMDHWRACHAYPLNAMQINLRRMARKFDIHPLVAQRTKRLLSIGIKLGHNPKMKLTQMQDVAGCRAVLKSSGTVKEFEKFIRKESRMNHIFATVDDYIRNPKDSGYRGIHLVYRFHSQRKPASQYNGLKIEIQIRSQFQHAWATTVETVGTFLGEALKASRGSDTWLRFFALMSSAIALREQEPVVPNTPLNPKELISELDDHAYKLNVENRLKGYANAIQTIEKRVHDAHYFLLELDPNAITPLLNVTGFARDKTDEAQKAYAEAELRVKEKPGTDAVLVSVDSISNLSRAYPNYYADTSVFLNLLDQALTGKQYRIHV
jgi:hypothetical protein